MWSQAAVALVLVMAQAPVQGRPSERVRAPGQVLVLVPGQVLAPVQPLGPVSARVQPLVQVQVQVPVLARARARVLTRALAEAPVQERPSACW